MAKVTKKELLLFLRRKLAENDMWALRGLMRIYDRQTADEKASGSTKEFNKMGFTGVDAEFLSSLAQQYDKYGRLSSKQKIWLKKKMPKYAKQIYSVSDMDKLLKAYERESMTASRVARELVKIARNLQGFGVRVSHDVNQNIDQINDVQDFVEDLKDYVEFSGGMKQSALKRCSAHLASARKELQNALELYYRESR
jgi:hypothetical protein